MKNFLVEIQQILISKNKPPKVNTSFLLVKAIDEESARDKIRKNQDAWGDSKRVFLHIGLVLGLDSLKNTVAGLNEIEFLMNDWIFMEDYL